RERGEATQQTNLPLLSRAAFRPLLIATGLGLSVSLGMFLVRDHVRVVPSALHARALGKRWIRRGVVEIRGQLSTLPMSLRIRQRQPQDACLTGACLRSS